MDLQRLLSGDRRRNPAFQVRALADFDADTKTWRNTNSGKIAVWRIDDFARGDARTLGTLAPDLAGSGRYSSPTATGPTKDDLL